MAWGLEVGVETLRLCRAEIRRGRLHLLHRAEAPLPPGMVRPSLKDSNFADPAGLTRLLRDLCGRAGCRGWVRAVLPDSAFSLRTVATDELPAKRQEAERFLRWQARDLLPFPVEEARLDFLLAASGPDGRMRVVCLMARDRVLGEFEGILADAGLRPAVLDASTISLAQAGSGLLDRGTVGLLSVHVERSTFLLLQEGRPRFWRILPAGRGAWAAADRARLLREVADSVTFCYESEGIPAAAGVLLGGLGPQSSEVASALAEWLAVPVTLLDLCASLRTEGHPDDLIHWGAAIGAAIRSC